MIAMISAQQLPKFYGRRAVWLYAKVSLRSSICLWMGTAERNLLWRNQAFRLETLELSSHLRLSSVQSRNYVRTIGKRLLPLETTTNERIHQFMAIRLLGTIPSLGACILDAKLWYLVLMLAIRTNVVLAIFYQRPIGPTPKSSDLELFQTIAAKVCI